ncbi:MAG: hypothetical protein IT561_00855 [Alphaproteobacteria bacterium]|nr:hypothetical protein [Alphaproteobacteria bacterium]
MPAIDDATDLLVPLFGVFANPLPAAVALGLALGVRSRWTVRAGTAAVAAFFGLLDVLERADATHQALAVVLSAVGGLLVAEVVLIIVAPLLAGMFGLAHALLLRLRPPAPHPPPPDRPQGH